MRYREPKPEQQTSDFSPIQALPNIYEPKPFQFNLRLKSVNHFEFEPANSRNLFRGNIGDKKISRNVSAACSLHSDRRQYMLCKYFVGKCGNPGGYMKSDYVFKALPVRLLKQI